MQTYPFQKMPLTYDYISLSPYCDPDTLALHHNKIYTNCVDMLNYMLSSYPQYQNMELRALTNSELLMPPAQARLLQNFAGGVYNHELYFSGITDKKTKPHGKLITAINDRYGSIENFKKLFTQAAFNVLGAGWVWLNTDSLGNIHISITPDNNTPSTSSVFPVFVADIWEHAYYLRYPAQLTDYMNAWFAVLDWDTAESRYTGSLKNN